MRRRVHPLTIVLGLRRYVAILLLPAVREAILLLLPLPLASWEALLFNEIAASAIVLTLSLLRWLCMSYTLTHDTIVIESGVLFRRKTTVRFADVAAAELVPSLLLSIFDAARLHLDTLAGSRRKADITLLLSSRRGRSVLLRMGDRTHSVEHTAHAKPLRTAVTAASASNAVTGLIFAVPLIQSIGRFIGKDLQSDLLAAVDRVAGIFVFGLPQVSAALLVLLFLGQFFAFVRIFSRSVRLEVKSGSGKLRMRAGFFRGFHTVFHQHLICGLDFRRGLFERLFGLRSVAALSSRNTRGREEREILFPAVRKNEAERLVGELLPGFASPPPMTLRPKKRAWFGFVWLPALGLLLLLPAAVAAHLEFSEISPVIPLLTLVGAAALALRLAAGIFELLEGGAAFGAPLCVFSSRRGLRMHAVRVRASHVHAVKVTQNPFQRRVGRCHLRVTLSGEGKNRLVVRHVDFKKAQALVGRFFAEREENA